MWRLKDSLGNTRAIGVDSSIKQIPLYAAMNFLDDSELLRMACKAIEPFVDDLFLLRRRVETFPDPTGKYEGVKTVPNEMALRNALTDNIPKDSYILCVDDDEIFFGDWRFARYLLNLHQSDYGLVYNIELSGRVIIRPRVLWHTEGTFLSDDIFGIRPILKISLYFLRGRSKER